MGHYSLEVITEFVVKTPSWFVSIWNKLLGEALDNTSIV